MSRLASSRASCPGTVNGPIETVANRNAHAWVEVYFPALWLDPVRPDRRRRRAADHHRVRDRRGRRPQAERVCRDRREPALGPTRRRDASGPPAAPGQFTQRPSGSRDLLIVLAACWRLRSVRWPSSRWRRGPRGEVERRTTRGRRWRGCGASRVRPAAHADHLRVRRHAGRPRPGGARPDLQHRRRRRRSRRRTRGARASRARDCRPSGTRCAGCGSRCSRLRVPARTPPVPEALTPADRTGRADRAQAGRPGPIDRLQRPGPRPELGRFARRASSSSRREVLGPARAARSTGAAAPELDDGDARRGANANDPEMRRAAGRTASAAATLNTPSWPDDDRPRLVGRGADAAVAADLRAIEAAPRVVVGRGARAGLASAGRTRAWTAVIDSPPGAQAVHAVGARQPASSAGQRRRIVVVGHALPLALTDLRGTRVRDGRGTRSRERGAGQPARAPGVAPPASAAIAAATASAVSAGSGERRVDDLHGPAPGDRQGRGVGGRAEPGARRAPPGAGPAPTAGIRPGPGSGPRRSSSDSPCRSRTSVASSPSGMTVEPVTGTPVGMALAAGDRRPASRRSSIPAEPDRPHVEDRRRRRGSRRRRPRARRRRAARTMNASARGAERARCIALMLTSASPRIEPDPAHRARPVLVAGDEHESAPAPCPASARRGGRGAARRWPRVPPTVAVRPRHRSG